MEQNETELMLKGYGLTTAEFFYRMPDYTHVLNTFVWQEYDIALIELDKAIERSPNHIAAISGKALTLIGLKRDDEAQIALRKALSLNPWLKERQFLKGEMPVPKTDL